MTTIEDLQSQDLLPVHLSTVAIEPWQDLTEGTIRLGMARYRILKVFKKCKLRYPPFPVFNHVCPGNRLRFELYAHLPEHTIGVAIEFREEDSEEKMIMRIQGATQSLFNKAFSLCWPLS